MNQTNDEKEEYILKMLELFFRPLSSWTSIVPCERVAMTYNVQQLLIFSGILMSKKYFEDHFFCSNIWTSYVQTLTQQLLFDIIEAAETEGSAHICAIVSDMGA